MDASTRRRYLDIVRRHLSDGALVQPPRLLGGNDHDLLVVGDRLAFRFPKRPRPIDRRRERFLERLAPRSPLPLPLIEAHRDPVTGIEYEVNAFISGVSFTPEIARTFTCDELVAIAQGLGSFLSALHAFPLDEARAIGLDEVNPLDFWAYMEQNPNALPGFRDAVYPLVTPRERAWIEAAFGEYIATIRARPFPVRVTHADIWTYRIIVDPRSHTLAGVIDFWGRIGDPARDFKAFEYYGADVVDEVYQQYRLPRDDDFERRRLFYTAHDEMFELARQVRSGSAEGIVKHRRSLAAYIADHPRPG